MRRTVNGRGRCGRRARTTPRPPGRSAPRRQPYRRRLLPQAGTRNRAPEISISARTAADRACPAGARRRASASRAAPPRAPRRCRAPCRRRRARARRRAARAGRRAARSESSCTSVRAAAGATTKRPIRTAFATVPMPGREPSDQASSEHERRRPPRSRRRTRAACASRSPGAARPTAAARAATRGSRRSRRRRGRGRRRARPRRTARPPRRTGAVRTSRRYAAARARRASMPPSSTSRLPAIANTTAGAQPRELPSMPGPRIESRMCVSSTV